MNHICVGASLAVDEFVLNGSFVCSYVLFCILDLLLLVWPMHFQGSHAYMCVSDFLCFIFLLTFVVSVGHFVISFFVLLIWSVQTCVRY